MESVEKRMQALRVLNEQFKHEGKFGCLDDRQVKLVLDAMVEFREMDIKGSVNDCGQENEQLIEDRKEYESDESNFLLFLAVV